MKEKKNNEDHVQVRKLTMNPVKLKDLKST